MAGRRNVAEAWSASVLTLFPEMFPGPLGHSLAGKALETGLWRLAAVDVVHPVGDRRPLIYLSPRGRPLTQARVRELAAGPGVALICGRFEGLDQRVIEARAIEEISLGDFVLSGGEPAAIALIDAVVRLLPGVMGKDASGSEESFESGLLEYPHYTRPQIFEGREIPPVLTSGDHQKVRAWRRAEAEKVTRERRPDLWDDFLAKKP